MTSIEPIALGRDMRIKVLSADDLEQLHQATLEVLAKTGARFPLPRALKIFADAGADVDEKTRTVRIPPDLLMTALSRVPRNICLGSRGGENLDLLLNGSRVYCGTAGTGTATIDPGSGTARPSTKADTAADQPRAVPRPGPSLQPGARRCIHQPAITMPVVTRTTSTVARALISGLTPRRTLE